MGDREKLRGTWKYNDLKYLENEKSFLDELKIIFHNCFKSYHLVKKWKRAGTSLKLFFNQNIVK